MRQALEWDVFVPNEKNTSTVTAGWVTLEGPVERWSQREDAERAVRNLTGVKIVVNKIAVTPAKPVVGTGPFVGGAQGAEAAHVPFSVK